MGRFICDLVMANVLTAVLFYLAWLFWDCKRVKYRTRRWDDGLGPLCPGDRLKGRFRDEVFRDEPFDSEGPTFFWPIQGGPHIRYEVNMSRHGIVYAETGVHHAVYTMGWPGVIKQTENRLELLLDDDNKDKA